MTRTYKRTTSGWTDERRTKHAAAMRRWAPWTHSTGPRTMAGKNISRLNALKHGQNSAPVLQFMKHVRNFQAFMRLCFHKRMELWRIQQNELLNTRKASAPKKPRKRVQRTHNLDNFYHFSKIKALSAYKMGKTESLNAKK